MRVLVVDDEEIQRISLQDDLREAGYDTTAVESPNVALELVLKNVTLQDLIGGSASYYDTHVKLIAS